MTSVPATAQAFFAHEPVDGKVKFTLEDVSVRELKDDEVLVRMVATGICHTDLIFASLPKEAGPYCKVLGHEGGGYVEQVGASIAHVKHGDAVLLSFSFCGKCRHCEAHHPSFCQRFSEINCVGDPDVFQNTAGVKASGGFFGQSSFSSLAIAKGTSVVNVSNLIQNEEELKLFAPLGCGFQTGAGTVDKLCSAREQDVVLIFGLGGVGLSSVMAAKLIGCRTIIGVDRFAARLDLAVELGATHTINTSEGKDLVEAIKELTDGGSSITIDTTGNPDVIEIGMAVTANRGQMVVVGVPPLDYELKINLARYLPTGKSLRSSIEGDVTPAEYIPKMIDWYRKKSFPIEKIVKFYPAKDMERALADMYNGLTVKPVIVWQDTSQQLGHTLSGAPYFKI